MQLRCIFYDDKIEEMLFFNRCLRECSWKMITWKMIIRGMTLYRDFSPMQCILSMITNVLTSFGMS